MIGLFVCLFVCLFLHPYWVTFTLCIHLLSGFYWNVQWWEYYDWPSDSWAERPWPLRWVSVAVIQNYDWEYGWEIQLVEMLVTDTQMSQGWWVWQKLVVAVCHGHRFELCFIKSGETFMNFSHSTQLQWISKHFDPWKRFEIHWSWVLWERFINA